MSPTPPVGQGRKKVITIGPALSNMGGMSTHLLYLLESPLTERYRLVIIASHRDGNRFKKLGVFLGAIVRFLAIAPFSSAGLVDIHFTADASFWRKSIFVRLAKLCRKKIILHAHTSRFDVFLARQSGWGLRYIGRTLRMADCLVVLSPHWARYWSRFVPFRRIRVVPNAVPVERFAALGDGPKQGDRVLVVSLSLLDHYKGTWDILAAAPRVVEASPRALFLLAGGGEIDEARRIVAEGGLGDHVEIRAYADEAARDEIYSRAQVALLPSYREGVPYTVLEAMAAGLAVVATTVGGIPDVAGGCALLVEPGDVDGLAEALIRVVNDKDLREELGRAARERMRERYDVGVAGRMMADLYDEVGQMATAENSGNE